METDTACTCSEAAGAGMRCVWIPSASTPGGCCSCCSCTCRSWRLRWALCPGWLAASAGCCTSGAPPACTCLARGARCPAGQEKGPGRDSASIVKLHGSARPGWLPPCTPARDLSADDAAATAAASQALGGCSAGKRSREENISRIPRGGWLMTCSAFCKGGGQGK